MAHGVKGKHVELGSPEDQELREKFPPPPCAVCGGLTGVYGTPGFLAAMVAMRRLVTCSEPCETTALAWFDNQDDERIDAYVGKIRGMIPHAERSEREAKELARRVTQKKEGEP